jgi:hypothetical protein
VNHSQAKTMIEIQNDTLHLSFPAITAEIEQLVDGHIAQVLPALLGEDRETAAQQFIKKVGRCTSKAQEIIRQVVLNLSAEDVARQLKKHSHGKSRTGLGGGPGCTQIDFQRTLRIPDDGKIYDLPPSYSRFPLRHVDDYANRLPPQWLKRGGLMMPMYQSEALWLNFSGTYPFAIKIAAGKINAVSGEVWSEGLHQSPQDYVVTPKQPWLDGFAVERGVIRQFVAMPLGAGYSVEEQLTGKADFGGLQFQAVPMKARHYFDSIHKKQLPMRLADVISDLIPQWCQDSGIRYCMAKGMGIGAGGRMKQQIYADPYTPDVWDMSQSSRCFLHLCDALMWRQITGENPPHTPFTAEEYEEQELPWFEYYRDDLAVLEGSKTLAGIQSVNSVSLNKGELGLSGNETVKVPHVINLSPSPKKVKEWTGE